MQIFVNTCVTNQSFALQVEPSDTIGDVKAKVHDMQGWPPESLQLVFAEGTLPDHRTLEDCSIQAESTLHLVMRSRGTVEVSVKRSDGKTTTIDLAVSSKVSDLKARIEELEGIPRHQQRLLLAGRPLEDTSKVQADWATTGELKLLYRAREDMRINVATLSGKTITLDVQANDTVKSVKCKLRDKEGIPQYRQRLIFNDGHLVDVSTLAECGIDTDALLHLVVLPDYEQQIFLKCLTGKTIVVPVPCSDSIRDMKEKVLIQEGIPIEEQRIIWAGRSLEDHRTLNDYNVGKDPTMHLLRHIHQGG